MPRSDKRFNAQQRIQIQAALQAAPDKRSHIRWSALSYLSQGKSVTEVACLLQVSRQSVHNWVNAFFHAPGLLSLGDADRTGRPKIATAITDDRILKALALVPQQLGYAVNSWTVGTLLHYLTKRYKCAISVDTLRRRMRDMGLRYKRPRYVYSEKAPNRAQKKGPLSES